jgi:hypothetical protein
MTCRLRRVAGHLPALNANIYGVLVTEMLKLAPSPGQANALLATMRACLVCQRPVHTGARLSRNAAGPSCASAL